MEIAQKLVPIQKNNLLRPTGTDFTVATSVNLNQNGLFCRFGIISVMLLALMTVGCDDSSQNNAQSGEKITEQKNNRSVSSDPFKAKQTIEQTTKAIGDAFQQQQNQMNQALNELSQTLDDASESYEKNLNLSKENVNNLAEKLGNLAKQAGKSARTLEDTGKTLGNAIKNGFEQGYQEGQQPQESNSGD